MAQKPNSDKSGRATRRREERDVAQAQRTVARAQTRPQPLPTQEGTPEMQISVNDLLRKIGVLTMERDVLRDQLAQRDAIITRLTAPSEAEAGEEPTEKADEGPPQGETVED